MYVYVFINMYLDPMKEQNISTPLDGRVDHWSLKCGLSGRDIPSAKKPSLAHISDTHIGHRELEQMDHF